MASYIDPLIAFVSANAWLAYLTLFLAALLEAVPVVGSVIPGSTVILALSALVPSGELKLQWVLLAAIAGALVGDGSAFWAGHRSQREILSNWPLTNYPGVVAQSEAFFQRWGIWAVFFARFIPPIRAFVPMTAGALAMPPSRFYPVNLLADPAVGAGACAAGRDGRLIARPLRRFQRHRRQRQASLDSDHHRLRDRHCAGGVDYKAPARRQRDRARSAADQGRAVAGTCRRGTPRPGAGPT